MAEETRNDVLEVVETPVQQQETPSQPTPVPVTETLERPEENKTDVIAPSHTKETSIDSELTPTIKMVTDTSEDKPEEEEPPNGSVGRDAQLARVENEKRMSLIKAWEESEKCKAENKAHKKLVAVEAWENSKKAEIEAELRKIEENLEKKKAEYREKMKNKVAMIHKEAEEKKAMVEAKRGEDVLKLEEMAAKCRATGKPPKKLLGLF